MRRGNKPPWRNPGARVDLPTVPCPACGNPLAPGTVVELDRQDGNLGELWRAGFAHGIVVGAAIATFAGGAALLVWGVL